ncbi:MAG: GIY-YIG nuclease family protein [Parafilimonas sp.]
MSFCCYILYSSRLNKYYIGSTSDVERRLEEHNRGKEKFTKTGLPWVLMYKEEFADLKLARQREYYIKKMKSRKFIESLISSAG